MMTLDDYRITSPDEIEAMLRRIQEERALVTLSGPDGSTFTTLLWSIDAPRGVICFNGESGDQPLHAMLESGEVSAMAYLDRIKVQFDLDGLVHVRGGQMEALNARLPQLVYRFQRREAFRVEPFSNQGPAAEFRHPGMPDMTVSLRVLDVSLSGVALFIPEDVPAITAGTRISQCHLRLDGDTELHVGLLIHYVTGVHPETRGARLGCELTGLEGRDRALQHYINQTQKRRVVLAG